MTHSFTIDLEAWFCSHNLGIDRGSWDGLDSRIEDQTHKLLKLLDKHNSTATFFVLGWVADHYPDLIKTISSEGHDIGTHGYGHLPCWDHDPNSFEEDLKRSLHVLDSVTGKKTDSFRAPAFSITPKTDWVFQILTDHGISVDSSVYPMGMHPEYGMKDAPLEPYPIHNKLHEVPMSCVHMLGKRLPISGGAYFRFLPYGIYRNMIKKLQKEGRKLNFYIHPWELDDHIPSVKNLPFSRKVRHYYNTGETTFKKLENLLKDFQFSTLRNTFMNESAQSA